MICIISSFAILTALVAVILFHIYKTEKLKAEIFQKNLELATLRNSMKPKDTNIEFQILMADLLSNNHEAYIRIERIPPENMYIHNTGV
jgi:hypothetical protein